MKSLLICSVRKKMIKVTTNLEKKSPSLTILATLSEAITIIPAINAPKISRDNVIR